MDVVEDFADDDGIRHVRWRPPAITRKRPPQCGQSVISNSRTRF